MSRMSEARRMLDAGVLSAEELVRESFGRIRETDPSLGAFASTREERALSEARSVQIRISEGEVGALTGIPCAVKDNFCVEGEETACGSAVLSGHLPAYDADVVLALRNAGAPILGKTKMDEFAMGSTGQLDFRGPVDNPLVSGTVPGGSSGGSAASVASGEAYWALGSDTGGSVILPAAFCGVTGFAPSWGTLSRYGLIAFASGYDQPGILAETPADAAAVMQVLASASSHDMTLHSERCTDYSTEPAEGPCVLGLPDQIWDLLTDPSLRAEYEDILSRLSRAGYGIRHVPIPGIEKAVPLYRVLTSCQAYSNLARYDGVRYGLRAEGGFSGAAESSRSAGFGPEVKRRILIGASLLGKDTSSVPYYARALAETEKLSAAFSEALRSCDFLLLPSSLSLPPKPDAFLGHPGMAHMSDLCATGCDLSRLPTLSVPFPASCFPKLGLLLSGPRFSDGALLRTGERIYREVNA